jgi:hypothetical protein
MSVHVSELHTDVVPAGPESRPVKETDGSRSPIGAVEQHWLAAHSRVTWLAGRVSAEGFDD